MIGVAIILPSGLFLQFDAVGCDNLAQCLVAKVALQAVFLAQFVKAPVNTC